MQIVNHPLVAKTIGEQSPSCGSHPRSQCRIGGQPDHRANKIVDRLGRQQIAGLAVQNNLAGAVHVVANDRATDEQRLHQSPSQPFPQARVNDHVHGRD